MDVRVRLDQALRLIGTNENGHETFFDTSVRGGGLDSAASPMETVLEAAGACMTMDIVPILRKQRKSVEGFSVALHGVRAEVEPKVFTSIEMSIQLESPDTTIRDLARAIQLSLTKYCSVSAMLRKSGCEITWRATLIHDHMEELISSSDYASDIVSRPVEA